VLLLALTGIGLLTPQFINRGPHSGDTVAGPVSTDPVKILAMKIRHYRGEKAVFLGEIGPTSHDIRFNDDIRIHAELSEPAYCYLIAFNPDGKVQMCSPRDETTAPGLTAALDYPPNREEGFPLTDGVGLQCFVLVASRQPLPSYREWQVRFGSPPWQHAEAEGIWRFDGQDYVGLDRGEPRPLGGRPKPLVDLCTFFGKCEDIEAIHAVAFPVKR
jgi:hypothetical protein